ncbi:hypothetical protein GGS21DRAFT_402173 [Xylaria nigripes]|nr:hypothetical protein GGS21DRAFT_402173 [Xylaria nigripes]
MANPLAALKVLLCPAGDSCTAFQCLFSHARDTSKSDNSTGSSMTTINHTTPDNSYSSRAHPIEDDGEASKEEPQRKRLKFDLDDTVVIQAQASSPKKAKERVMDMVTTMQPDVNHLSSPLKTGLKYTPSIESKHSKISGEARLQQPAKAVTTANPTPMKPESETQAKKPKRAPESLNPRLLKKAPASHAIRVALVKALHKEFQRLNDELKKTAQGTEKQLLLSDQELIYKALDDEQEIAVKKTSIYNTSIRNRILAYKRMTLSQWKDERNKAVQSDNPASMKLASTSLAESLDTGLTTSQEIEFLPRFADDFAALEAHGYITKIPSKDDIEAAVAGVNASGNMEICDRCTRRFQVFPGRRELDGALASNGPCTYHPGKVYYVARAPGDRSKALRRFRCCQRSLDDDAGGCTTAKHHVFKTTDPKRLAATLNFVKTPVNPDIPKDRAVSFDCEMGYTVYGLELIRLTVVSWPTGDILLDILVRPVGEVLDLNTRFSGVQPEDMALAERCGVGLDHQPTIISTESPTQKSERRLKIAPSPKVARDMLFTIIGADTPLIGHGLENDLNAARIIHPTCIDTVLLFPHARGLPMRNSLKSLMETKLGRKIQMEAGTGTPEGHDSAEDARAAGDLVRLKIRDEWKTMKMNGWTRDSNGKLLPPT